MVAIYKPADDAKHIAVQIDYVDNAAPASVLHTRSFRFPASTTNGEMQALVIQEGQRARAASNRVTGLLQAAPIGTEISIP